MSEESDTSLFRVAVDAMGGDNAPEEIVNGVLDIIKEGIVEILLVGDQEQIELLIPSPRPDNLTLICSKGVVTEDEHPVEAIKSKPRASVFVCADLVRDGKADAYITMGSTGAAVAAGVFKLGTLSGIERPALGGPFLGLVPKTIIIDLGTSVDSRPSQLMNYAVLGSTFSRVFMGIQEPRVALLSVGAEEGKGNRQVRESYPLLKQSGLNFIGNIEGVDVPLGKADVVVCDGFVGNILMKFAEGLGMAVVKYVESEGGDTQDILADKLLKSLSNLTNFVEYMGGGPLLGLNGVAIVGHGRSKATSVSAAIRMAKVVLDQHLVQLMEEDLSIAQRNVEIN